MTYDDVDTSVVSNIEIPLAFAYEWGPVFNGMKDGDSRLFNYREAQSFRRFAKKQASIASRQLNNEQKKTLNLDPAIKVYRLWIVHKFTSKELAALNTHE